MQDKSSSYPLRATTPRANRFRDITLAHLNNFVDGDYRDQNLSSALYEGRDSSESAVSMFVWSAPGMTKPTFAEAQKQQYTRMTRGFKFGPSWSNHWVRVILQVRKEWQSKKRVQFEFDPGCEAMIYTTEGLPLQGITGGSGDSRRVEYIIPESDRAYPIKLCIEVSANAMFGVPDEGRTEVHDDVYFKLDTAEITVPRMEAWHLMWDFKAIQSITKTLPTTNPGCLQSQSVAMEIVNTFNPNDLSTLETCREIAKKILGSELSSSKPYDHLHDWDLQGDSEGVPVLSMGNCHIDTAWLWPFSVTQQKIARSWSTQVDLMQRYPEYRFIASQAQQFKWLEELYPQLFLKVRREVENGKFNVTGGTWVEMDTNMPSGESFCRQFLYGQRFFKSRFGKYTDIFWLPDTFGYSSQIPQLCRLAGIPYFFTQKLSWSEFNKFPHSTFNWIGIDGTQMLVHMTPVDTYTAQAKLDEVVKAISNHKNLEWCDKSLIVYGNGDGGGGPLAPMIESLRRIRATSNHSPKFGIPQVTQGPSVSDFYKMLIKKTNNGKELPTWRGELYLEYHRGTYTSHASIKKHNRKSEVLLREIEYYATLASLKIPDTAYVYPKDDLDILWQDVLLCQFHDVLPGSAIAKVYTDAEKIYANIAKKGAALLESARQALLPRSRALDSSGSTPLPRGGAFVALNTLSFPRQEIIRIPISIYDGRSVFTASDVDDEYGFVIAATNTGNGAMELVKLSASPQQKQLATASIEKDVTGEIYYILANAFITVKITQQGRIVSITDTGLGRELILPHSSAGFVAYQDQPNTYDAWNVDIFHLDTKTLIDAQVVEVLESGGLRASLLIECIYGNSKISAVVSLDAVPNTLKHDALSMVRFDTSVEWRERHKFLKFEVPLDINSDYATYEIQYGTVQRPTHKNTTWDAAKFEVCGQRFADLSEFGYGVALLNDCKYGYACEGPYLRLSLLRASTYPDPKQDQGGHKMSFAILPHRGHFLESDVPQAAIAFNNPVHIRYLPPATSSSSSVASNLTALTEVFKLEGLGSRNIFLDAVKRGEDDTFGFHTAKPVRSVIVRLYEAYGGASTVNVVTTLPVQKTCIVDILERELEVLPTICKQGTGGSQSTTIQLRLRGFQVLTVKLLINEDS